MSYSEALLFIGKCLALGHDPEKIKTIQSLIRSGTVDWKQVVWVSTSHLVFTTLHLSLKRAGLLTDLPPALVEYMEELTAANRDRNRKIIDQAYEIIQLLNAHDIDPVFLKGCAHLLDGLYEDIAERMMVDIDILVRDQDLVRATDLLIANGYKTDEPEDTYFLSHTKHYYRLFIEDRIAGVEVHRKILEYPDYKELDNAVLIEKIRKINIPGSAYVLSREHQILHNILHVQVDHGGYYFASITLRQFYDLFLLSSEVDPLAVISDFGKVFPRLNANLAAANYFLGNPPCLPYQRNRQARHYLSRLKKNMKHPGWAKFSYRCLYVIQRFSNYPKRIIEGIYSKGARQSLISRLKDPKWYKAHWNSYRNALRRREQ